MMAENDQNIQTASLDLFKKIVIKDGISQGSNEKGERIAKNLFRDTAECKRGKHSAVYCQVCFPHNINGFR